MIKCIRFIIVTALCLVLWHGWRGWGEDIMAARGGQCYDAMIVARAGRRMLWVTRLARSPQIASRALVLYMIARRWTRRNPQGSTDRLASCQALSRGRPGLLAEENGLVKELRWLQSRARTLRPCVAATISGRTLDVSFGATCLSSCTRLARHSLLSSQARPAIRRAVGQSAGTRS